VAQNIIAPTVKAQIRSLYQDNRHQDIWVELTDIGEDLQVMEVELTDMEVEPQDMEVELMGIRVELRSIWVEPCPLCLNIIRIPGTQIIRHPESELTSSS